MKAYKFGADQRGEIWVSAADMEKYTTKREKLLVSMQERGVEKPLQMKVKKTVEALRTYEMMPKSQMTIEQQQLVRDAAYNILSRQKRI